jgi:type 1 glutamine amidotransferase
MRFRPVTCRSPVATTPCLVSTPALSNTFERPASARSGFSRLALLCLMLLALAPAPTQAQPEPGPLKRVLVFDKHLASQTEPYSAADSMVARLGRAMGFTVRITADSNQINDDTLATYQAVVWNNVMRNVLSAAQQQAFTRYMENGGGYIGFHAAATNRRLWPWYVDDFLGGDNHDSASIAWGKTTLYADTVARPGHAQGAGHYIMQGVPGVIPQYGEWYKWNPNPADNPAITILQWYQPKPIKADWPQALPVSWCREYGAGPIKGRMFYIQVSHMDSIYVSAWYKTMIGNAFKWVAHGEAGASLIAGGSETVGAVSPGHEGARGKTYRPDGRMLIRRQPGSLRLRTR